MCGCGTSGLAGGALTRVSTLVAEDRHGQLWAIQAKAYDSGYRVTKHDVDTFLAESGRSVFSFRLLIATTNLIGHTAKRTIEAQEKQASVLLLGDLEAAEVDWPASPSDLRSRRLPPKRPRPHQRQAMNAVVKGFDSHDRGQLIMACGTGKTLAALFIHERLAADAHVGAGAVAVTVGSNAARVDGQHHSGIRLPSRVFR